MAGKQASERQMSGDRPADEPGADRESNLSLALKRSAEMAAVFMIGDGALGLLQAARHVELWRSNVAAVDVLVRPFGGRPGRRRAYGVVQMAAGVALAAALRRRR